MDFKKEVQSLIGEIISFKRIAGNSVILYFHGMPGDSNIKSLWIDPIWRYEIDNKYVISSSDFPYENEKDETDEKFNTRFDSICATTDSLINSKVLMIQFDDITNDIFVELSNNQSIKTFACSAMEEMWVYRNKKNGLEIVGSRNEIFMKKVRE